MSFSKRFQTDYFGGQLFILTIFFLSFHHFVYFIHPRHTNVIKECVQLLENYAKLERYAEMFWDQATVLPLTSQGRTFYDPSVQTFWDEIIKAVISLPDRVSNIYKLRDGSVLWPVGFFKMIGKMIVKVLKMVHEAISGLQLTKYKYSKYDCLLFVI